ncbi:flagellar biosynthesis protein FlhB [Hwanghaeella grinnelliae]|uniref:Flagellar biosynthesis protein FlhB n=1 Tax=Hwanghaeella grinnelliae TaxID=2500179 RepID=A0A3S2W2T2_9PROT|nr:EscU/YscU/HrcU family type III secretion system export apparatus switch protein [Hwanghaeella grinnelliae]RVU34641.1 flagellar biosynthesis protein FlhB [Hwanghaeella grinnelliae]
MSDDLESGKIIDHKTGAAGNKAVALSRGAEREDKGPTVLASGTGFLADRIVEEAFKAGVAVRTDADLVEILSATEVGEEIPIEAFIAVAEILRYVYERNQRTSRAESAARDEDVAAVIGQV